MGNQKQLHRTVTHWNSVKFEHGNPTDFHEILSTFSEGHCTVRSKLNKFEHVWALSQGSVQEGSGLEPYTETQFPHMDRQTRLKTLPSRNIVSGR